MDSASDPATAPRAALSERALALLVCPTCRAPLELSDPAASPEDNAIRRVSCSKGHEFSTRGGYLDLSGSRQVSATTERTFESFGYEWNTFSDVREEDDEFAQVYFRDLDLASLGGLRGLDAGCGKGRYTRYIAQHLGALVALDGSSAVEAAARNLAEFESVAVVKSDLRGAPVVPSSIDFLMSLGVLHHLEDPEAGFKELVGLLSPSGRILLYLYSRPSRINVRSVALAGSERMRRLTTRMSHRALKALCLPIALMLYLGVVRPGAAGDRLGIGPLSRLPMSAYRGKPFRSLLLDTFDRLSAPVEHRYVWSELEGWFERASLEVEAVREETGWFVLARRR